LLLLVTAGQAGGAESGFFWRVAGQVKQAGVEQVEAGLAGSAVLTLTAKAFSYLLLGGR